LLTIAGYSSAYRFLSAGFYLALCGRFSGIPISVLVGALGPLIILAGILVSVGLWSVWYFHGRIEQLIVASLISGGFTLVWIAASYAICRPQWTALVGAIFPNNKITNSD